MLSFDLRLQRYEKIPISSKQISGFLSKFNISILSEGEVELFALEVGTGDLNADGVAKLVLRVVTAAYDHIVLLVEVVVVVAQVADGDHALAVVLVDLGVDAIGRDAADVGVVAVANLILHELDHLVLDGVALGILGDLLHVAAMLAVLLVLLLVG